MAACVVCDEVITQPICAGCREQEVVAWLQERLPNSPELLLRVEELRSEIESPGGRTWCIGCKEPMALCSHCYVTHIFAWVERALPEQAASFAELFGLRTELLEPELESLRSCSPFP